MDGLFCSGGPGPRPGANTLVSGHQAGSPLLMQGPGSADRSPRPLYYANLVGSRYSCPKPPRTSTWPSRKAASPIATSRKWKAHPEYFWFSPQTKELAGFHLVDAHYYPIDQDAAGRLPSVILGLRPGVAEGLLRFYTPDGALIPTLAESVALEQARAEQERLRADQERLHAQQERACAQQAQALADQAQCDAEQERLRAERERDHAAAERLRADAQSNRADRLAARLRALGVDPEGA